MSAERTMRFGSSGRLFGRKEALRDLQSQLTRISSGATVVVKGASGIGKTSLVKELQVDEKTAWIISAKGDQFQPLPGGVRAHALEELGRRLEKQRQILEASEGLEQPPSTYLSKDALESLDRLLSEEASVLTQLIPSLTSFCRTCANTEGDFSERVIRVAAESLLKEVTRYQSLVIFCDDLQWIDAESLVWVSSLVALPRVLLILGHRDDECLSTLVESFLSRIEPAAEIRLERLPRSALDEWLSHLLSATPAQVKDLADYVEEKTSCNPYFVLQLIELMQRRGLVRYSFSSQTWEWSVAEIVSGPREEAMANVREVVKWQLATLPLFVQQMLQVAACLGYFFDQRLLRSLLQTCDSLLLMGFSHQAALAGLHYEEEDDYDVNPQDVDDEQANSTYTQALQRAEAEGWIVPTADPRIYQFAHDRIQQTVYESMAEGKELALLHLRIGKHIQDMEDKNEREEYILVAADHFNRGSCLLVHEMERLELMELNLEASAHAKKRAGINLMADYLQRAIALSQERDWAQNYELVLELHTRAAEAEFTRGQFEASAARVATVITNAKNLEDVMRARFVRMQMFGAQRRFRDAIKEARRLLLQLGERVPRVNAITFLVELNKTKSLVGAMSDADFVNLAPISEDRHRWIALIVQAASVYGWNSDPDFAGFMFLRLMRVTLTYGCCQATPFAYAGYGLLIAGMGQEKDGFRFADLAMAMVKDKASEPAVKLVCNVFLFHMERPAHASLDPLLSAYRVGLETGEILFGSLALCAYSTLYIYCGLPLEPFISDMRNFGSQLRICGQDLSLAYILPVLQLALNLTGKAKDPLSLTWDSCREENIFGDNLTLDEDSSANLFMLYAQMFNAYLLGDLVVAKHAAAMARGRSVTGTHFSNAFHAFLDGMVYLALYKMSKRKRFLKNADRVIRKLTAMAEKQCLNCPAMLHLLEAEKKSLTGNKRDTKAAYDVAIQQFTRSGFVHLAALANERAGEFMGDCCDEFWEEFYISKAIALYDEWGAIVKTKAMAKKYSFVSCGALSQVVSINFRGRPQFCDDDSNDVLFDEDEELSMVHVPELPSTRFFL